MPSSRPLRACLPLILTASLALAACEQPKWDDPAYVSQQLLSADATVRKVAMGKIGALSEDQKKALLPALVKVYLEKDLNQKEVMSLLVRLRDPAAKDAYLEEVKTNATGFAGVAAEALGDAKAKEAIGDMIKLLETTDDNEIKQGLLRGMAAMPDPQMVPALVKVLQLDADNNPIALHSYSCDILGEIAQDSPQSLDQAAIKELARGVFLSNTTRQDVSKECGLAVQRLGTPAVAEFIKILRGEREDIKLLMSTYKFPINRSSGVAATRLTGLRAKEAVAPFIEALSVADISIPSTITSREDKLGWVTTQVQVFHEIILGLGDLGAPEARELLTKILLGEKNKDYSALLDYTTETQLRQDAAEALNRIGDRSAAPALLKAAKDGVIVDLEKIVKAQEAKGQAVPAVERYSFNIISTRAYINLAGADAEAGLKTLIDAAKNEELKKEYQSYAPVLAAFKECDAKGDPKAKAACYSAKLKDQNALVREKAVYEISRLPSDAAAPVLLENLGTSFMDTRELIIWALYRHPTKDAVAKVEEQIKKDEGQRDRATRMAAYLQTLLLAWLKNNAA